MKHTRAVRISLLIQEESFQDNHIFLNYLWLLQER